MIQGLDWRKVERKEYPAPIKIDLQDDADTSNFNACFTAVPICDGLTAPLPRDIPPPPGAGPVAAGNGKKQKKKDRGHPSPAAERREVKTPEVPSPRAAGVSPLRLPAVTTPLDADLFRGVHTPS